jgi:hypothetical protein
VVELVGANAAVDADRLVVDLAETDADQRRYRRSVARTIHDSQVDFDRRNVFVQTEDE